MAMRDGYRILANIADASRGGTLDTGTRSLDQQSLIDDLEAKIKG